MDKRVISDQNERDEKGEREVHNRIGKKMDLLSKYGMTQNYKIRETRVSWVNWCGWIEFVIHKDLANKKNHLISLITLFGKKWRIRTLYDEGSSPNINWN